jgi:hypothetical protein
MSEAKYLQKQAIPCNLKSVFEKAGLERGDISRQSPISVGNWSGTLAPACLSGVSQRSTDHFSGFPSGFTGQSGLGRIGEFDPKVFGQWVMIHSGSRAKNQSSDWFQGSVCCR